MAIAWVSTSILLTAGCQDPLQRTGQDAIREQVFAEYRQRLSATAATQPIELSREDSDVEAELSDERRRELDRLSGPDAYEQDTLDLGRDLQGREDAELVRLTLQDAVRLAVEHNLDLSVARLSPQIAEARLREAQAEFDWVFFAGVDWSKLDTPQPPGSVTGLSGDQQDETLTGTVGLRKPSRYGGTLEVETSLSNLEREPSFFIVDDYFNADAGVTLTQPLLRGFGRAVNEVNIELARDAAEVESENLRDALIQTVFATEQAYWDLVFLRRQLLIRQRQLERTRSLRDTLFRRRDFDVLPASLTDANARVEQRRAEVIRARVAVRQGSDRLKRLINDPELPVSGETVIMPADDPVEAAARFDLVDEIATALRHRPELRSALTDIRSSATRLDLADSLLLPQLDLTAGVNFNGIDLDDPEGAYDDLLGGDYIDYVLGVRFERPLGNRSAEANLEARQLERRQAVERYRQLAQVAVIDVKDALRTLVTNYELIGAQRAARRAAADALRALQVEEDAGGALTPDFIDRKLQQQDRLAEAEAAEAQSISAYNTSLADLYSSTGTLLERRGIEPQPARN